MKLSRKSLAFAAVAAMSGIASIAWPALAFNPQPDPPGKTRLHTPAMDAFHLSRGRSLAQPSYAKPDCRNWHGSNRCS